MIREKGKSKRDGVSKGKEVEIQTQGQKIQGVKFREKREHEKTRERNSEKKTKTRMCPARSI